MDPDLVIRAQRGDEEAFASVALACGDRLHASCGTLSQPNFAGTSPRLRGDIQPDIGRPREE